MLAFGGGPGRGHQRGRVALLGRVGGWSRQRGASGVGDLVFGAGASFQYEEPLPQNRSKTPVFFPVFPVLFEFFLSFFFEFFF